jgi:hypothetical protein
MIALFRVVPGGMRRFGSGSTLTKTHVFASQTCLRPLTCLAVSCSVLLIYLLYISHY